MEGTRARALRLLMLESSGDDCGGSALLGSDDAVAGIQGRRRWATQGTKGTAVGAPGHGCGRTAGSGHEGEGVECGVACWPTPPSFK